MPLLRSKLTTDSATPATLPTETPTQKAVPTHKRESPMTKDDYWRNREERDIAKDQHIRLSGILQALLGSVNFGQYCTVADKESYLAEVESAALRLAKFVTEKA